MWGLFTAFAVVGGLVIFAYREKADPILKPALQKAKLAKLARLPASRLTLDQAEDGMVLSRKFEEHDLERRFAKVVMTLKTKRPKV
jgi:hypothetical protein